MDSRAVAPHRFPHCVGSQTVVHASVDGQALDYVACWEDEDALSRVGGNYARGAVEHELWPWLKQMGFADDGDDAVLLRFLDEFLGNWPANMRPGLRFRRVWTFAEAAELGSALAETIRSQFDAVFAVAHEPALQTARPDPGALPPSTGNPPARKPRPVQRRSGAGRTGPARTPIIIAPRTETGNSSAPAAASAPSRSRPPRTPSAPPTPCRGPTPHYRNDRPDLLTCALIWPNSGHTDERRHQCL